MTPTAPPDLSEFVAIEGVLESERDENAGRNT